LKIISPKLEIFKCQLVADFLYGETAVMDFGLNSTRQTEDDM